MSENMEFGEMDLIPASCVGQCIRLIRSIGSCRFQSSSYEPEFRCFDEKVIMVITAPRGKLVLFDDKKSKEGYYSRNRNDYTRQSNAIKLFMKEHIND